MEVDRSNLSPARWQLASCSYRVTSFSLGAIRLMTHFCRQSRRVKPSGRVVKQHMLSSTCGSDKDVTPIRRRIKSGMQSRRAPGGWGCHDLWPRSAEPLVTVARVLSKLKQMKSSRPVRFNKRPPEDHRMDPAASIETAQSAHALSYPRQTLPTPVPPHLWNFLQVLLMWSNL